MTDLDERLAHALAEKGPAYVPRTRHLHPDGRPKYVNRLVLEASPYLLQHAHNPVDWYPWGDEAFADARARGVPVFLSIGYATCHWCHVMEEESFEDEEIAGVLRELFVSVKVDREERPDVDGVYMAVVQALTGRGGWPMSVFLTPDREPFFGGTYYPPRAGVRGARQGFVEILHALSNAYASSRERITEDAQKVVAHVRSTIGAPPADAPPGESVLALATSFAEKRFDPVSGGVRGAPKFPSSFPVRFLLRYAARTGESRPRKMALTTLARMHAGGIHDAIGGGFHRYSVDGRWLVPHFEKMLYDNAQLVLAYLEAGEPELVDVARTTLDYLLREMRRDDATFHSATDADSVTPSGARDEGYFFSWTKPELRAALGEEDAALAATWFGVTDAGNFEGRTVLSLPLDPAVTTHELGLSREELEARLVRIRTTLYEARAKRPPPLTDEKALVSWNALVVSALARAALSLGDARYGDAAVETASVLVRDFRASRSLPHLITTSDRGGRGFLDDHAFLALALLDVFELTADARFLDDATALLDVLDSSFRDPEHGGYFLTHDDAEALIAREKPLYDGATPSGNSIAAIALLRLASLTEDTSARERADRVLGAFASLLPERLPALEQFLVAVELATRIPAQILVVLPSGEGALREGARPFVEALGPLALARSVFVAASEASLAGALGDRLPWAKDKRALDGRATAYVCAEGTCSLPTNEPAELSRSLAGGRRAPA